jgi:hypothetical protein
MFHFADLITKANELYGRDSAGLLAVADDNQLGDRVIFSH